MKKLGPKELLQIEQEAEFGDLTLENTSKRHIRILVAFCYVGEVVNKKLTPCLTVNNVQGLIETIFEKSYPENVLLYWMQDLLKRNYLAVPPQEYETGNTFYITNKGITLVLDLCARRESLLTSNSINFYNHDQYLH